LAESTIYFFTRGSTFSKVSSSIRYLVVLRELCRRSFWYSVRTLIKLAASPAA
jgi:hypothetical protein